ncbi:MAG: ribosome small subunit-dependent GTPase A [Candidatus Melainabacteria bacterium]
MFPHATDSMTGLLRKYHANFYYVALGERTYECSLKGVLKKALTAEEDSLYAGDLVDVDTVDPETGTARIVAVHPRRTVIHRPKIANVDQAVIVFPLRQPAFDAHAVNVLIMHVMLAGLQPVLCISKSDLAGQDAGTVDPAAIERLYHQQLGIPVVFTSIFDAQSLLPLKTQLAGRLSVLAGPSGAGKSSLLNQLDPSLSLKVGEVSARIARGQHTTRHVELLTMPALGPDTWVADTPGFSNLTLDDATPAAIEAAMPDFVPWRASCAFSDCLHLPETPDCAVRAHIGDLDPQRYTSYLAMLTEARTADEKRKAQSSKTAQGTKTRHGKGREEISILRLSGRQRAASRRTQRQATRNLADSNQTDDDPPETADP